MPAKNVSQKINQLLDARALVGLTAEQMQQVFNPFLEDLGSATVKETEYDAVTILAAERHVSVARPASTDDVTVITPPDITDPNVLGRVYAITITNTGADLGTVEYLVDGSRSYPLCDGVNLMVAANGLLWLPFTSLDLLLAIIPDMLSRLEALEGGS